MGSTCLDLLLAIISRMFQLIFVKLLIVFFFVCFYNNKSRCSLGVFTAELICMQRWACELA